MVWFEVLVGVLVGLLDGYQVGRWVGLSVCLFWQFRFVFSLPLSFQVVLFFSYAVMKLVGQSSMQMGK